MAAAPAPQLWDGVAAYTKAAQERGCEPLEWTAHLSSAMSAAGAPTPSADLARTLVSHLCWSNDVPLAWKYLERALVAGLAPAPLLLALLSKRVIPRRRTRPAAYRLFLELLRRHLFNSKSQFEVLSEKIMRSIDDVLHLSQVFGTCVFEAGVVVVHFVFYLLWQLLDATVDDDGLKERVPENSLRVTSPRDMDIDGEDKYSDKRKDDSSEKLQKINTLMAMELLRQFLEHKVISRLLSLARELMPVQWESFTVRIHLLEANSLTLKNSTIPAGDLMRLALGDHNKVITGCKHGQYRAFSTNIVYGSPMSSFGQRHRACHSSLWIPIDLYLEDCIDMSVSATNSVEILSGLVKSLQAVNSSTWHDAFLGLWMSSLRLVQRERDPIEGPVPRLDARLCILLSVTILAIARIIEEEEFAIVDKAKDANQLKDNNPNGKCRKDLVSSLQALGDYESLLVPPPSVVSAANQAAVKAMILLSGIAVGNGYLDIASMHDKTTNLSGNMRHLIVEACISRNLLDTSAYYWPGYVIGRMNQIPRGLTNQVLGWSALMNGVPLTLQMVNALVTTPASSLAELERIYEVAVNGSNDDKISAAAVLCGASLISGWNVQEHAVRFVVKLLTPLPPVDNSGSESHLISHGPTINVVLAGISSVDCVQVFSYHGFVPELAGALMAICEVFGSCVPNISWMVITGEEITPHAVFSNAFILLMRLWKFNHPPLEYCMMGDAAPVGSQLNPEYLLLLRNSRVPFSDNDMANHKEFSMLAMYTNPSTAHPIFLDSFPKLKLWYRQHQACLASTLSGLVHGTPVHQNVDALLNMMFRKIGKGGNQPVGSGTSGSGSVSSSSGPGNEDSSVRPKLPAWDIMEAVPFVVDAALTACSHGIIIPRDLATGLKDLADFLPASLATIVSYFSAEVTRGVWKPAFMNGTDWPSPAANLSMVEEQIKKIVGATGVDVPSLVVGATSPATLPLPLAAFVSLTITYKLDKASERFLNLAGPALETLAASCPWPSMPIVAALWTQKVKRWSDFLIFSASRTIFHHNNDAVVQLLRSCFAAAVGFSTISISNNNGGVGGLLGHGFGSHFSGGLSPVAPGILYLRVYKSIKDIMILADEMLSLLMSSVKEIAERISGERSEKTKKTRCGMRCDQVSFSEAMARVRLAASVGATLLWLSGGSGLVQCLVQEILPSWFLSANELEPEGKNIGGMANVLGGYALSYFAALCVMFAWGIDSAPLSKRRTRVIASHMEFLAGALDGKISLGCDRTLWRAYVTGFLEIVAECAPSWVLEVDLGLLKKLCKGLKQWNEEELAISLLMRGGVRAMGAAAEAIILAGD